MKKQIFYLLSIIISTSISAQVPLKDIFSEFSLSINRTYQKNNDNMEGRSGFGAGIYHSFMPGKTLYILTGLEYNYTSQFKKYEYQGHFASSSDITYQIHNISIPLGIRVNIGKKTKVFCEAGGFADLNIFSKSEGTWHHYPSDSTDHYSEGHFEDKAGLSNSVGLYIGIGVIVQVSKFALLIKSDYKYGMSNINPGSYGDMVNRYFRLIVGVKFD